jgi:transposase
MVHIGVDLHKQFSQIAVLTPEGELSEHRLANKPDRVRELFTTFPRPSKIAVEATGSWWWMVDLLKEVGHEVILSHPKQTRAIAAARLKNDRVDATRLATLLRANLLPAVWIPPMPIREGKELLRHRMVLVATRTRLKNRLHAFLGKRNLRPTRGKLWFTDRGERQLRELALSAPAATIREDSLALIATLDERIAQVDAWLSQQWGEDLHVRRLMTLPGVGRFTAIAVVVELGDIHRFPTAKHLASYVGLVPVIRASADHVRTGPISKQGNSLLRWLLVSAAIQAVRKPGPLRTWARVLRAKKGRKATHVAVARRLVSMIYHVWKEEIDYIEFLQRSGVRG